MVVMLNIVINQKNFLNFLGGLKFCCLICIGFHGIRLLNETIPRGNVFFKQI